MIIIGDVFVGGQSDADHQKGVIRRCKMARSKVQGVADFWQDRNKWMVDYWQDRWAEQTRDRAERDRPVSLALHGDRIAGLTICKVGVQMIASLRKHEKCQSKPGDQRD